MAEVSRNVYDILSPSPSTLKEIVHVSIAVQLWRQEINTHRIKNTLSQLNFEKNILSNCSATGIPATDLSAIENYIRRVGFSIKQWLTYPLHDKLFSIEQFNDFIDFAVNFDGTINHVRTAKRLVLCEKIELISRFQIACRYCFEDDILRIWPSVSSLANFKSINTYVNDSLVFYWLCRLRNQLYRLPSLIVDDLSFEEKQIIYPYNSSASAVEFFWIHLDANSRMRLLKLRNGGQFYKYYRYLLPKFTEVELHEFTNNDGSNMLFALLCTGNQYSCDDSYRSNVYDGASKALHTMLLWTYIKSGMNESIFFGLIRKIILTLHKPLSHLIDTSICCKLWNTAPDNLKVHAIRQLLLENSLFQRYRSLGTSDINGLLILTILSDASAEDRSAFWNAHWRSLIDIMCTKDFDQLMRLCYSDDENQIIEFKQNTLSGSALVRIKSSRLLNNIIMEELNNFLSFCYPDEQTRKNVQLGLLLDEFRLGLGNITKISPLLNDFINEAYDDANLAEHFKTQLLFSPSTLATFAELIEAPSYGRSGNSIHDGRFIDVLAPSELVARHLKKLYFSTLLKQKLLVGNFEVEIAENEFSDFIRECFTAEDDTADFKEKLTVDEIVQQLIRRAIFESSCPKYNSFLAQFLEWYFVTSQELAEFKAKYADDDVFVKLTTKPE